MPFLKETADKVHQTYHEVLDWLMPMWGVSFDDVPWILRIYTQALAAGIAAATGTIATFKAGAIWTSNSLIAPTAVFWLELIEKTRRESTEGINKVMLATLSEMFGVEFDKFDLPTGTDRISVERRALIVGSKITELLEREFTAGGGLSPEQGEKASKMFTGFSANFAIASAFTGVVGELMTAGQVEAFGEFGVELADNLGLGRMARGGLRELVATTVATPYDWHMNKKYRPTLLSATGYVEGWWKQTFTEDEMREKLRWLGHSEQNIDAIIANARPVLGDADLSRLIRHGQVTREDAITILEARGYTRVSAEWLLRSNELLRLDARIEESINFMQTLTRQGTISLQDFFAFVDSIPLGEEEKHQLRISMGEIFEHPRKGLTLPQMKDAYIEGVINLGDYERYLENEGYSFADADVLVQLLLIDAKIERDKRAEALARKLKPKISTVSLGQMRQAFIDGLINLPEWDAKLLELGYSDDDRRLLTLQVLVDKAEEDERGARARLREEERQRRLDEKAGETP